jgi:phosphatidylglycerol:prolipoprotein diacylglycerol transferase
MLMLGFVAGILLSRREARRLGLSPDLPLDLGIWVLVAAVASARGLFVALNWADFAPRPLEVLYVWREGGLSFHGGLLGGVLAALVFARTRRMSFWTIADVVTPGLALGYGIARFGCFLNGCCYGAPTDLPWGVRFPTATLPMEPRHPTQIYSAIGSFAILGVLLAVRRRLVVPGQLFLVYLMLYSPMRAAVEILRKGYTATVLFDGVTEAQVASAIIFVAAAIGFALRGRRRNDASKPGAGQA